MLFIASIVNPTDTRPHTEAVLLPNSLNRSKTTLKHAIHAITTPKLRILLALQRPGRLVNRSYLIIRLIHMQFPLM